MSQTLFAAKNLQTPQLRNVKLELNPGDCAMIRGTSGSGKTVLLKTLADLLPREEGSLFLEQQEVDQYSPPDWRRQVMWVPAEAVWWHPRIDLHFDEPPTALMESMGLTPELLQRAVAELSSGQRQRLALIRALCRRPKVLLLDEPTANLDDETQALVESAIKDYLSEPHRACIWVSHNTEQIERLATQRYEIEGGRLHHVTDHLNRTKP